MVEVDAVVDVDAGVEAVVAGVEAVDFGCDELLLLPQPATARGAQQCEQSRQPASSM